MTLAIAAGAGFVARGFSGDIPHLVEFMKQAITYESYALLDIPQPCVVCNIVNTFRWYRDRVYHLSEDSDYTDREEATKKALEFGDKIPIGVLYKVEKEKYEDKFDFIFYSIE